MKRPIASRALSSWGLPARQHAAFKVIEMQVEERPRTTHRLGGRLVARRTAG